MALYPALKKDIYFATLQRPEGTSVKIRDTTTQKNFKPTSDTVTLLSLCTGSRSVTDIVTLLSEQSGEPADTMAQGVEKILKTLQEKGIITMDTAPLEGAKAKHIKMKYPLEFAQVEITNRCNLSCLHCFNNSGSPYPNELTTAEIFSIIDTLSSLGVDNIVLSGGEPLMHPDLFEIIKHAREAPMTVTLFTNGTLITEEHIREFKKLNIRGFNISIDDVDENIHDTFRGKKGALRKTLRAVNLCKEAGFHVKISISLNQLNKDHILGILQYFKEHNLTEFGVTPVTYSGRGIDSLAVSPEECHDVWVNQFTYYKEHFPEVIPHLEGILGERCGIARDMVGIKSDGTIIPCPGSNRALGVGNIRDVDLEKFWVENETLETLRNITVKDDEKCRNCTYLTFCMGCVASAYLLWKEFRRYYPYLCASRMAYDEVFEILK